MQYKVKVADLHSFQGGVPANRDVSGSESLETIIGVLSWLIFAGGILTIAAAVYTAYAAYGWIPTYDAWSVPDYLATHVVYGDPSTLLQYLWAQYNEHRILVPKLFLLADWKFFQGRDIFAIASILAVRLLDLAVLLWVFRRMGGLRGARWRTAAGIAGVCLFAPSQLQNLESGFQIAFVLPGFFVHVAVALLVLYPLRRDTRTGWKNITAMLAAGTAATYSLAAGIVVWPILLLTGLWLRISKWALTVMAVVSAAVIGSYLYHYHSPPGHSYPPASLHHPMVLAQYAAAYLGAPWAWGNFSHPVIFGSVGLALAAAVVARMFARRDRDGFAVMFSAVLAFDVGTSVLTGLGRVNFGTAQSSSSRYETFSLVFWLSLAVMALHYLATRRRLWFVSAQAILLAIMVMAGAGINGPIQAARNRAAGVNAAALAVVSGVFDHDVLMYHVAPVPEAIWGDIQFLGRQRLSIFDTDLAHNLNQPLRSAYEIRETHCWGQVLDGLRVGDGPRQGIRLRGWTWDPVHRRPVRQIVFADGGNIIGYGQPGFAEPETVALLASRRALYSGWLGYVRTPQQDATGRVYGVVDFFGKQVCQVDRWLLDPHVGAGEALQFATRSSPQNNR